MPRSRQKGGFVPTGVSIRQSRLTRSLRLPLRRAAPNMPDIMRTLNEATLDPYSRWWIDNTTGRHYEDEEGYHVSEDGHGHECFGCVYELDSADQHCSTCNRERGFQGGAKKKTRRRRRRRLRRKASTTRRSSHSKRRKRSRRVRRG